MTTPKESLPKDEEGNNEEEENTMGSMMANFSTKESSLTVKSGTILILIASLVSFILFNIVNLSNRVSILEIRLEGVGRIETTVREQGKKIDEFSLGFTKHQAQDDIRYYKK
jgi:hypothetical protein